jgi:hypothetical protein
VKGIFGQLLPSMIPLKLATGALSGGILLGTQALVSAVSAQTSSQWLYSGYLDSGYASDGRVPKDLNY